jgi:16S rRNA (guanine(527)-N(7))-methyltransferase RsmG
MSTELRDRLQAALPDLDSSTLDRVIRFHEVLLEENEKQNLTRLVSPKDFVEGHVLDVRELLGTKWVDFPAMDLGSGCGVPGALAAAIAGNSWVLAESERHKAEFLFRVVRELGLTNTRVVADRGESFLLENQVQSVVARAVGPVERIYGWLQACSTWNNLILLKGPAWKAEWETFRQSKFRDDLAVDKLHEYRVGDENKQRVLVKLRRVPRGT